MTKKQFLLTALGGLAACGLVLYANKDWFAKPFIQISHRLHAFAGRFNNDPGTMPLLFEFNRPLKLTAVKVVDVSALQTNKNAPALWQMTSGSHSVPTRGFLYGMAIPGMRPVPEGSVAGALEPGVHYRLQIEAGSLRAQHDFTLGPTEP